MRNVKFISIFAACGFVLSFVFGLFSHSSFFIILLRALLFSIIFVIIGFLISFIFKKFLLDSNSLGFESEETGSMQQKKAGEDSNRSGQVIDVVVEDEELPASESDNHFVVGSNAQMLKKTDIGETQPDDNKKSGQVPDSSFVPMAGFETVKQNPGKSSSVGDVAVSTGGEQPEVTAKSEVMSQTISDDDLDTLPDMESLNLAEDEDSGDENESYTDSEFVPSANNYKKSGSSGPDIKDAALIAKAISTALSEEN